MPAEPSDPGATTPPRRTSWTSDPHPARHGCGTGRRGGVAGGAGGSSEGTGVSGPHADRAGCRPQRDHLEDAALNRAWSFGERARRPLVTWVVDHATRGPDRDLELLRSAADTLVVSTWTVLAHDVSLAVLDPDGTPAARQPLRVVLGTRDLDPALPVLAGPGRTLHFATRDPHLALAAI